MAFDSKLTSYALVALLVVPGVSVADEPNPTSGTEGCRPDVQVNAVNGQDPATSAAPDGYTDQDDSIVAVAVSHAGDACHEALNSPPQLLSPWVTPIWGPPTEWVTYHVTYVDIDGDAPTHVRLIIDNATTIDLAPALGSISDYAAGVEFEGSPQTPLRMGAHSYRFQAADSYDEARTETGLGPRIIDFVTGAVDQANPANRMVIHPIANGPTLVPASEVPPTLLPLLGNPLQGILSYTFDVDPEAGNGRAEAVVSSWGGDDLLRDGGFENPLDGEWGNHLLGAATTTTAAHTGTGAVDVAPPGAIPDAAGTLGGIDLALRPYAPLAQWQRFEFWTLRGPDAADHVAEKGVLRLRFDLDLDYDGDGDACLVHHTIPPTSASWLLHEVTLDDSFSVFDAPCEATQVLAGPVDGPKPLADIQDNPMWGKARLTGAILGIDSRNGTSDAWATGESFLVDDLVFIVRGTSAADFDACYYAAAPATPPISCVSDIGPHDGPIPAGTQRVNVWADTLLPSGFVFEHPYIEPGTFFFHYLERGQPPAAGPWAPGAAGSVTMVEDVNGNQEIDADDLILARVVGIQPSTAAQVFHLGIQLNPGADGLERPDGALPLLVEYDDGLPEYRPGLVTPVATKSLVLQWFQNDAPTGTLAATQRHALGRKVEFTLAASDPDDGQGAVPQRFGGLQQWRLDFGDGAAPVQGTAYSAVMTHKYAAGSYAATMTVLDTQGTASVSSVDVGILHPGELAGQELPDSG